MKWTFWIGLGATYGALAVIIGAFGGHLLKSKLSASDMTIFQTATRFHMHHSLALLAVGFFGTRIDSTSLNSSGWLFALGTLMFSGSLYGLSLTKHKALETIAPAGGALLVLGWGLLAWTALSI